MKVATSQFSVSSDIRHNLVRILMQMQQAKELNCHVIQFPEGSLSGYAGSDFESFLNFNWPLLRECTTQVLQAAKRLGLWVILGSTHPLTPPNKPHNSVYIINNNGEIVDRYDKRFCAGTDEFQPKTGDLAHYSPGNHFVVFSICGITCSVIICHEYHTQNSIGNSKQKMWNWFFIVTMQATWMKKNNNN